MENFIMTQMPTVYFGEKALQTAFQKEASHMGNTVLLAYGGGAIKRNGIYEQVIDELTNAGKQVVEFSGIMSNPTYAKVQEGVTIAKEHQVDFILAVGGGSVIDCCKIVSAQAMLEQDLWKLEFQDHQYPTSFIPMGAVVTASGTGSEMNNGAVITNEHEKIKAGMLGALSNFAVLDPTFTLTVPFKQVISGAFDTLSHAMETYFGSPFDTNVSDEINEAIMRNTIHHIREVIKNPDDVKARSELMWDSAMAENGILKLGKQTDFQAHQIEHQLGAYTDCNHGQGLAVIQPVLYEHIYQNGVAKFARFAKEVWGIQEDTISEEVLAKKGVQKLAEFVKEIGLPTTLREMGIDDDEMLKHVAYSSNISKGCCKQLTKEEIYQILLECK